MGCTGQATKWMGGLWVCLGLILWMAGQSQLTERPMKSGFHIRGFYYTNVNTIDKIPDEAYGYPNSSLLGCSVFCSTVPNCWMLLYRAETYDCRVFAYDKISNFASRLSGVSYRLYYLRPFRIVLYFLTGMQYQGAVNTCEAYGGILYTPRTDADVKMLHSRGFDGFVGLKMTAGKWYDSAGQPFTDTSLWIYYYPSRNGVCVRVKEGSLVDCSCENKNRSFVCDIEQH